MPKPSSMPAIAPDVIYVLADKDGDFATQPHHNSKDAHAERRAFAESGLKVRILKYRFVEEIL